MAASSRDHMVNFIIDNQYRFYRRAKQRTRETVTYALAISAIFAVLNEASIFFGFTPAKMIYGHLETAGIIFLSFIAGFFLISLIFSLLAYGRLDRNSYLTALFVLVYSATPFMLLGWIPHAVVKTALLIWALIFLMVGIHVRMKKNYKQAALITIALVIIIAIISLLSQNFVLAPV